MADYIENNESGSSVREKLNTSLPRVAQVNISTSQFLNCGLTPIEIVPAPGVGKAIVRVSYWIDYKYGGTPFQSAGSMSFKFLYDGGTFISDFSEAVLDQTASYIAYGSVPHRSARANIANKSLMMRIEDAVNPTDGNSTAVMSVTYEIIDLS